MQTPITQDIHTAVRAAYGAIAARSVVGGCCGPSGCGCDADGGDALAEASEMLAAPCCGPSREATCCAPSEKASCCGSTATTGTCGCQGA